MAWTWRLRHALAKGRCAPNFDEALTPYLADCKGRGLADSAIRYRFHALSRYGAWLLANGQPSDVVEHTPAVAAAFLASERERGLRPATIRELAGMLRVFSSRLHTLGLTQADVYAELPMPRASNRVPQTLTEREVC